MNWRDFQALQKVVELGDRFVSYVDEGQGEPVVLLHGIPTWGFLWSGLFRAIALSRRVLVPDLLGYGFSDKRDCFDRSIARQAEMIDAWMDRLGLARAAIVGHDIGGGVALQLTTRFPTRVARLCLINSVCYDSWPIELMLQLGHPKADRKLSAAALTRLLEVALRRTGFAARPPEGVIEGLLAPYRTEVGKRSLIRNAVALDTNHTTELMARLARISVPTLVLWGEDDPFQKVEYGERLAWDIPGARLVRVANARHFAMFDQPHEVAMPMLAFLGVEAAGLRIQSPGSAPPA